MEKFQRRKIIIRFLICTILFASMIWGILVWNNTHISQLNISAYAVYRTGTDGYEMHIDSANCSKDNISTTKDYITISGWVANKNESIDRVTIDVILIDTKANIAYAIPTTIQERTDIAEYFGLNNLKWSGFAIKIPYGNKIDTEKSNYEIAALLKINDNNAVVVDSGKNTEDFKTNEK